MTSTTLQRLRQRLRRGEGPGDRGSAIPDEIFLVSFFLLGSAICISLWCYVFLFIAPGSVRADAEQLEAVNEKYDLNLKTLPLRGDSIEVAHEGKSLTVTNSGAGAFVFEGGKEYVPED